MSQHIHIRLPAALATALLLAACEEHAGNPVVFGQTQALGITLGQSPTTQAPEFVFGFKDANIAILPTVAVSPTNEMIELGGTAKFPGQEFNETYSVLGQFNNETPTQIGEGKVVLGKFFATGIAAQKLSAGFACSVSDGKDKAHCHKP